VAYDFWKITDLTFYQTIMKYVSDYHSLSQLFKLILEEAREMIIENTEKRD
jgi:hypothetical protein